MSFYQLKKNKIVINKTLSNNQDEILASYLAQYIKLHFSDEEYRQLLRNYSCFRHARILLEFEESNFVQKVIEGPNYLINGIISLAMRMRTACSKNPAEHPHFQHLCTLRELYRSGRGKEADLIADLHDESERQLIEECRRNYRHLQPKSAQEILNDALNSVQIQQLNAIVEHELPIAKNNFEHASYVNILFTNDALVQMYADIGNSTDDIPAIAQHLGVPATLVQKIK
jgi:hypothetical protein